jgi:CheY-like chemotaxis protein
MTPPTEEDRTLVLIVDDDAAFRRALGLLLRAGGYDCVTAADATEGFAAFQRSRPRVVLTDMAMPGASGVELVRKVRAADPGAIIIGMSGDIIGGAASPRYAALKAGADACLDKPFEENELLVLIDRTLAARA